MNKTSAIIDQLSDMFKYFNKELNAELPEPLFTLIPNRGRSSYYGWYWQNRWCVNDDLMPEINIAPDHLNRSVDAIAETLLHEMSHLKSSISGIKDCNSINQYHNRKFKDQAESFGLTVYKIRGKGYAGTKLGERGEEIVNKYKTEILKGSNPFNVYRVVNSRPKINNSKKSVMIDKDIIEQIEELTGEKISIAVDDILRTYINERV